MASFSIITPCLNARRWLPLCVRSVADQAEIETEHIVQDGGSTDGTFEWLLSQSGFVVHQESDRNLYEAVNRGLRRATGDIVCHLNADEQLLPTALTKVDEAFTRFPEMQVVFGDVLLTDCDGTLKCTRRIVTPSALQIFLDHLPTYTGATFFRRSLLTDRGLYYNEQFSTIGDCLWVLRMLKLKIPFHQIGQFTTSFMFTGQNLSQGKQGAKERARLRKALPKSLRILRPLVVLNNKGCI